MKNTYTLPNVWLATIEIDHCQLLCSLALTQQWSPRLVNNNWHYDDVSVALQCHLWWCFPYPVHAPNWWYKAWTFQRSDGQSLCPCVRLFDAVFTYHSTQLVSDWQSKIVNEYSTDGPLFMACVLSIVQPQLMSDHLVFWKHSLAVVLCCYRLTITPPIHWMGVSLTVTTH